MRLSAVQIPFIAVPDESVTSEHSTGIDSHWAWAVASLVGGLEATALHASGFVS